MEDLFKTLGEITKPNEGKFTSYNLGFIGHKAEELQMLFSEYPKDCNEFGKYLYFENYTELVYNEGVILYTNCFESKKHFKQRLLLKLLNNLNK